MGIRENVDRVRAEIEQAKSNRQYFVSRPVVLVAATKYVGSEIVEQLINNGISDIGENRLQDARRKFLNLSGRVASWTNVKKHFIGHLQTNKVRAVLQLFDVIQSLDSRQLARMIDYEAGRIGRIITCMVELKVSPEATKFGLDPDDVVDFWSEAGRLKNVRLSGIMAMAPFSENPEESRPYFRAARRCLEKILQKYEVPDWHLSMGMSGDFRIAVEEGATMVRVGSALYQGVI